MLKRAGLAAAMALAAGAAAPAGAQAPASAPPAAAGFPQRIPAPGGEVILPTPGDRRAYDGYRYAAVRRSGDMLYLSGVIIFRAPGEGNDPAAFKAQVRRGLNQLRNSLQAAGAGWGDIVMINSFHVWDTPHFAGTRQQHFDAFEEVIGEFGTGPYPAWTAVGTTGLLADTGIVEVQLIARVPPQSSTIGR